jgi:transposase
MRGSDEQSGTMFSYLSPEERVPQDHPLRGIRRLTDRALTRLSPRLGTLYVKFGRPSVPPEQLLRALLLQALYSIRSERQLMEQLDFNILFRWFVGLSLDAPVWSPTTFSKNRDRLLAGDVAAAFFEAVLMQADSKQLLSHEHFTVDGTLLEAWASHKSFQRKQDPPDPPDPGPNPTIDFKGERRGNATHQSTTDPDARLYKKSAGREARLGYLGHLVMENRTGLIVDALVTPATGRGEREAALVMISRRPGDHPITVGADKAYDTRECVTELRHMRATPHVAQYPAGRCRHSAIDRRTTRHGGYTISQRKRKQVEQAFGWMKTIALLRKLRHRGGARVEWMFTFAAAAFNLVRMRPLIDAEAV